MKLIRTIYKTKSLAEWGVFLLVALIVMLLAANFFIPEYPVRDIDTQLLKLKGKHFRFSDEPHVREFIRSVKRNNGYICLGTSESTPLRDGNYYEFLDQDTSCDSRFSILGGAGWTCGLHMPMLIRFAGEVDSLQLIYFINPVYWRSELNGFKKSYWTRYLNYGTYKTTCAMDHSEDFREISHEYGKVLNPGEKFLHHAENFLRKIRKPFFHDLRYWIMPEEYTGDLAFQATEKEVNSAFAFYGRIDTSYLDTSWNVTHEFRHRAWLNPITEDEYRYFELRAFNNLCLKLGVKVTYILGPVNEIFITKYHAPWLDDYRTTVDRIRDTLITGGMDFVDAGALGWVPGSFIDNQHHSSYGAYLIAQQVKKHIHEKNYR